MGGACSRERAVQAEVWELARTARWLPPYKQPSTSPRGCCVALQGWSIGCVGWLPREPAGGERPPRTLGLDLSLPFRHACCMPGAMRDWILCPLGREGQLGCRVGPYISLAMEKQLPPERVVLRIQHS